HVIGLAERDSLQPLRIIVTYDADEGPLYHVGSVYPHTIGKVAVNDRLVRRELLLKPASVFKYSKVIESHERLYETGLFSQVLIEPLPDSTNTVMDFNLSLRERKPRWFDAGVGSGTEERFSFIGEWGHRNILGDGLQGVLDGRMSLDRKGQY